MQTIQSLTTKFALTKQRGFTLIEIMLVLALVVALTMAGLAAYQIQLRNFKVDKTALQMQQWLQAGLAYYSDCGQWPRASHSYSDPMINEMMGLAPLTSCTPFNTQQRAYMPAGGPQNSSVFGPWPLRFIKVNLWNYYEIGPMPSGNNPGDPINSPSFYVQTYLEPNNATTQAIAGMIAGRLPNAKWWQNGNYVYIQAYVPRPTSNGGGPGPGGGAYIVDMEMINTGQTSKHIKPPVCPPNTTPALVSAISSIDSGSIKGGGESGRTTGLNGYVFNQKIDDKTGFIYEMGKNPIYPIVDPNKKITNQFLVVADQDLRGGTVVPGPLNQVLMISACIPDTTINPKLNNTALKDKNLTPAGTRY